MTDFKVDGSGNLSLENGDFILLEGDAAIIQRLNLRLEALQGKYFMNLEYGIPYFEEIIGLNPEQNVLEDIFREEILLDPEVSNIEDFVAELNGQNRVLDISFTVIKTDGGILEFTNEGVV